MTRRLIQCLVVVSVMSVLSAGAASPASRFVGGTPIGIQTAPWAVLVGYGTGSSDEDCTGSILTASLVLTSAYCLYNSSGGLEGTPGLTVTAGVSNYVSPAATDLKQTRTLTSVRIHPGFLYSGGPDQADNVALLTLSSPLDLSGPDVQAVALPAAGAAFPTGDTVSMAAFGTQTEGAVESGQLESMAATVDPQGECGQPSSQGLDELNAVLDCATSPASSLCDGDTGAGLVANGATPVLVGVANDSTSYCAAGASQTGFAYIGAAEILDFIQGNNQPPTAPRVTASTSWGITWGGSPVPGVTLYCDTDSWGTSVRVSYSFMNAATGQILQSGPRNSYVLPRAAVGTTIDCEAAVTNAGGTTRVLTDPTTEVKAGPELTIAPVAPLTVKPGHNVKLLVLLFVPDGMTGTAQVCVEAAVPTGRHFCRSTRVLVGSYPFVFTFAIDPATPPGTSRIAISATLDGVPVAAANPLLRIAKS